MRVMYDYHIFTREKYGGISRYFAQLSYQMKFLSGITPNLCIPFNVNAYTKKEKLQNIVSTFGSVPKIRYSGKVYRTLSFMLSFLKMRLVELDVIHETYYPYISPTPTSVSTVTTIHDLIPELFPEHVPNHQALIRKKRDAIKRSDAIICVSRNTKRDLLNFYDISPSRVTVIHLGGGFIMNSVDKTKNLKPTLNIPKKYILFVGNRGGYKNFQRLCTAIDRIGRLKSTHLVCFGGGGFTDQEKRMFESLSFSPSKTHYFSGSDQLLAQLYQGASVLAYPSLYEGFGIPPLEAFQFGCPVLAGAAGSLPEVLGDAAEFCDPNSVESIASSLDYLLSSDKHCNQLADKGKARLSNFSWRKCAVDTKDVYSDIAT